jgi:hypothetical protein
MTEFGQFCCATDGECYQYPGTWNDVTMGFNEALMTISTELGVSWTPWSWRPATGDYQDHECQDINNSENATELAHPTDGLGADWQVIWEEFSN